VYKTSDRDTVHLTCVQAVNLHLRAAFLHFTSESISIDLIFVFLVVSEDFFIFEKSSVDLDFLSGSSIYCAKEKKKVTSGFFNFSGHL